MRFPLARSFVLACCFAAVLTACGNPDATRDDLMLMLTERAELSDTEAECIADRLLVDENFSQDELNKAAGNPESVPRFQDALDAAIPACLGGVGPAIPSTGPSEETPSTVAG